MGRTSDRRQFLKGLCRLGAGALAGGALASEVLVAAPAVQEGRKPLRIVRIALQEARGKKLTPVAPNAYAPFRGQEVAEPVLRVATAEGIEGIAHLSTAKPEALKTLLGLDPFDLFDWRGDVVLGPREERRKLLDDIGGADVALLDILGKALRRPIASLLGPRVRDDVPVYDSSLYMEDLLEPSQRDGLLYLDGPPPADPAEMVARKALWVAGKPEGIRILKIKVGRAKWMRSLDEAIERDIAVLRAVRRAVGEGITLFVDGNDGYRGRPLAAADLALAAAGARLHAMEEMFPEDRTEELRPQAGGAVKRRLRQAGLSTRLADGEDHRGGIPSRLLPERFRGPAGEEPLLDINQPDMNQNGCLRIRDIAAASAAHGLTVAPHNFGSKLGLYPQVHLGLVVRNWEFAETDDSAFPALDPSGIASPPAAPASPASRGWAWHSGRTVSRSRGGRSRDEAPPRRKLISAGPRGARSGSRRDLRPGSACHRGPPRSRFGTGIPQP